MNNLIIDVCSTISFLATMTNITIAKCNVFHCYKDNTNDINFPVNDSSTRKVISTNFSKIDTMFLLNIILLLNFSMNMCQSTRSRSSPSGVFLG